MRISFHLSLTPVSKARPRFNFRTRSTYTPKKTSDYEDAIKLLSRKYFKSPLDGPIVLTVNFSLPRPKKPKHVLPIVKPDLDNLVKAIKDALNGIAYHDDSQVVDLIASKRYVVDGQLPSVNISVENI